MFKNLRFFNETLDRFILKIRTDKILVYKLELMAFKDDKLNTGTPSRMQISVQETHSFRILTGYPETIHL
jgi:hypothetical protein